MAALTSAITTVQRADRKRRSNEILLTTLVWRYVLDPDAERALTIDRESKRVEASVDTKQASRTTHHTPGFGNKMRAGAHRGCRRRARLLGRLSLFRHRALCRCLQEGLCTEISVVCERMSQVDSRTAWKHPDDCKRDCSSETLADNCETRS